MGHFNYIRCHLRKWSNCPLRHQKYLRRCLHVIHIQYPNHRHKSLVDLNRHHALLLFGRAYKVYHHFRINYFGIFAELVTSVWIATKTFRLIGGLYRYLFHPNTHPWSIAVSKLNVKGCYDHMSTYEFICFIFCRYDTYFALINGNSIRVRANTGLYSRVFLQWKKYTLYRKNRWLYMSSLCYIYVSTSMYKDCNSYIYTNIHLYLRTMFFTRVLRGFGFSNHECGAKNIYSSNHIPWVWIFSPIFPGLLGSMKH